MLTEAEQNAGVAVLQTYVEQAEGWEAEFVPASVYPTAVADIVNAADAGTDQSTTGRQTSGQAALRAAIDATGYGGEVTDQMCADGASVVLTAVAQVRAQEKGSS